jgi:hypothetical protein
MKQIAFFGDSFVAHNEGWIEYFCQRNNYECVHTGKTGADPIFTIEDWIAVNNKKELIDVCIYAHTSASRLYHPDRSVPLTEGVVAGIIDGSFKSVITKNSPLVTAAQSYYLNLDYQSANEIKSTIIPLGVDRYIQENNTTFMKVIHLWSFAPSRVFDKRLNSHTVSWPFTMESGTNVLLDLLSLSNVEPGFVEHVFDSRTLHFSPDAYEFFNDLMKASIATTSREIDFRKYVTPNSTWDNYVDALAQIKKEITYE